MSDTDLCVCLHPYAHHALNHDQTQLVCLRYVPASRVRRPAAKPGEGVHGGRAGIPVREMSGIKAVKAVLLSRMTLCPCEDWRPAVEVAA